MKYIAIVATLLCAMPAFAADVDSQTAIDDATAFIGDAFRGPESSVTCKSTGKGGFRMTVANACVDPAETAFNTVSLNKQTGTIKYNFFSTDAGVCGSNVELIDDFLSVKDYRDAKRGVAKLCRETLRAAN